MSESQPKTTDTNTRSKIERAAFRIFHDRGIGAATYTAIAEESGHGRPLVQYYFPAKNDLVLSFVEKIMQSAQATIEESQYSSSVREAQTVRLSQVYFGYMLSTPGMRTFTLDLLSSRHRTSRLIRLAAAWALPFVAERSEDPMLFNASVISSGGIYEYIYVELSEGRVPPYNLITLHTFAIFRVLTQNAMYNETKDELSQYLLDDDDLAGLLRNVDERLTS